MPSMIGLSKSWATAADTHITAFRASLQKLEGSLAKAQREAEYAECCGAQFDVNDQTARYALALRDYLSWLSSAASESEDADVMEAVTFALVRKMRSFLTQCAEFCVNIAILGGVKHRRYAKYVNCFHFIRQAMNEICTLISCIIYNELLGTLDAQQSADALRAIEGALKIFYKADDSVFKVLDLESSSDSEFADNARMVFFSYSSGINNEIILLKDFIIASGCFEIGFELKLEDFVVIPRAWSPKEESAKLRVDFERGVRLLVGGNTFCPQDEVAVWPCVCRACEQRLSPGRELRRAQKDVIYTVGHVNRKYGACQVGPAAGVARTATECYDRMTVVARDGFMLHNDLAEFYCQETRNGVRFGGDGLDHGLFLITLWKMCMGAAKTLLSPFFGGDSFDEVTWYVETHFFVMHFADVFGSGIETEAESIAKSLYERFQLDAESAPRLTKKIASFVTVILQTKINNPCLEMTREVDDHLAVGCEFSEQKEGCDRDGATRVIFPGLKLDGRVVVNPVVEYL